MPQVRGREELPATVAELGPGLLVFFDRPSSLQSWAEVFGHEWRHVAITVQTDEGLKLANYGPKKMDHLLAIDLLFNYRRVAVARIFSDDAELERLAHWIDDIAQADDPRYTMTGPLVGPIHLLARRCRPGVRRRLLFAAVRLYCRAMDAYHRHRPAFCCSTYVLAAIQGSRNEPIRVPMSEHTDDLAAYAAPMTEVDALLGRWLCGPTELWRAISPSNRCDLDLTVKPREIPNRDDVDIDIRPGRQADHLAQDHSDEFTIDLTDHRLDPVVRIDFSELAGSVPPYDGPTEGFLPSVPG